jgi:hypothetical protein
MYLLGVVSVCALVLLGDPPQLCTRLFDFFGLEAEKAMTPKFARLAHAGDSLPSSHPARCRIFRKLNAQASCGTFLQSI